MQRHAAMPKWRDVTWLASLSARNRYRWPLPTAEDVKKRVTIALFKAGTPFDPDGTVSSCKLILDGGRALRIKQTRQGPRWVHRGDSCEVGADLIRQPGMAGNRAIERGDNYPGFVQTRVRLRVDEEPSHL